MRYNLLHRFMGLSRVLSIVCAGLSFCVPTLFTARANASGLIYKVEVKDIIHGVSARHIIRTIERAAEEDAELVLIELGTPGGLYESTRDIIEAILASERPVVVYVAPAGAHAASAGFLITLAADVAAMAPGTNTGAATPVSGTGQQIEETLAKKIQSDAAAYTRSIAERRGRKPELAEKAVTEAKSWTAQEALDAGLIDYIAASEAELLSKLEGTTIRRIDGSEAVVTTAAATIEVQEMSTKDRILSVVANPNIAILLALIGFAALYLEFSNPGMVVPGIVGAIALLLAAFAFEILPVTAVGILLLLVGFGLLIAEAFTPSFGALGTGGVISIVLGALMLFEEQPIPTPALEVSLSVILPVTLFFAALVIVLGRKVVEAQRQAPVTGQEGLLGKIGTARTEIEGKGKIFIHGEYWDARAKERIAEGARVKVVGIDGLVLDVEPVVNDPDRL
jgi:membrane-bound serine protease (ClpP class)